MNDVVREKADGELFDILSYTEDPIVSSDIIGNSHSSIFDAGCTLVTKEAPNTVHVATWYDNESGYAFRLRDLIYRITKR